MKIAMSSRLVLSVFSRWCLIVVIAHAVNACTQDTDSSYSGRFSSLRSIPQDPIYTEAWSSGFERGFPGEWLNYENGFTIDQVDIFGEKKNAWSIVNETEAPGVIEGKHAYKGWVWASQKESHRAYPVIHTDIATPLVNVFWVWLDIDYDLMAINDWIHFATWANNPDWHVHTMSVRDRFLRMAHLDSSYIGPIPRPDFPLRQWVRLTSYIHYYGEEGYIRVWQDGVPMLEGYYSNHSGFNLMRSTLR